MNPERYSKGWTEKKVLYYLYQYYRDKSKYFCRNKYIYDWESDGFFMTKSGLSHELEVKVSRSDFNKELKHKEKKHAFLKEVWECGGENLRNNNYNPSNKYSKEFLKFCPNKFTIVCQEELIYPEDIEDEFPYSGLSWVSDKGKITVKKRAEVHKVKQNIKPILLDKFFYRTHHLDYELYMLKAAFDKLPKETLQDGVKMTKFIKEFMKKVKI